MRSLDPALTLTLTLSLTLTLNHLANEALQMATPQYGLMYLTYGCATDYKYFKGREFVHTNPSTEVTCRNKLRQSFTRSCS